MITVKAIYEHGGIKFLEPVPPVERAVVAVVFLDVSLEDTLQSSYEDVMKTMDWGEAMDEEGASVLVTVHEQLAPYRVEAEEAYLSREGT